jgi:hypothetical protein
MPGGSCGDDPETWVQLARSDEWCAVRARVIVRPSPPSAARPSVPPLLQPLTLPARPFCRWAAHPHGWADARCPAALSEEPPAEASVSAGARPGTSTALPLVPGPLLRAMHALRSEADRRGCVFLSFTTLQVRQHSSLYRAALWESLLRSHSALRLAGAGRGGVRHALSRRGGRGVGAAQQGRRLATLLGGASTEWHAMHACSCLF